jgi:hypothetical protein
MSLYRDDRLIGTTTGSRADFTVPARTADYRLTSDVDMSRIQSVSTRTHTVWTFRSAGPSGLGPAALPLLSIDYDLGLDRHDHPTGAPATFTVLQSRALQPQRVTRLT